MSGQFASIAEKMKAVKTAWDKAAAGPKKDKALIHFQAAERALMAKDDPECLKELDAVRHTLI